MAGSKIAILNIKIREKIYERDDESVIVFFIVSHSQQ
jgi:hypothetical protein